MSTKNSRDVLDWFRSYANAKLTALGLTVEASNMNLPLTNDTRVQAGIDYLAQREAELIAAWTVDLEPFWQAAVDELWADINSQMPANIRTLYDAMWGDPDINVRRFLKTLMRVMGRLIQTVRAGG